MIKHPEPKECANVISHCPIYVGSVCLKFTIHESENWISQKMPESKNYEKQIILFIS